MDHPHVMRLVMWNGLAQQGTGRWTKARVSPLRSRNSRAAEASRQPISRGFPSDAHRYDRLSLDRRQSLRYVDRPDAMTQRTLLNSDIDGEPSEAN
jgi:hypothetical protein